MGSTMDTPLKVVGDFLSGSVIVATLFNWASILLALPAAIYGCLRIYDWWEHRVLMRGKKNQAAYIKKYREKDQNKYRNLRIIYRKGK